LVLLEPPTRTNKLTLVPDGGFNWDRTSLAPYPHLPPLPEPSSSFVLVVLHSGGGSSCPSHPRFVKALDSPIHPTTLKVINLILSSYIACVAQIEKFEIF